MTPEELDDVVRAQAVTIGRGDIVLIRTGWWTRFLETGNRTEGYSGWTGDALCGCADHEIAAVAADNLQVEDLVSRRRGDNLPAASPLPT